MDAFRSSDREPGGPGPDSDVPDAAASARGRSMGGAQAHERERDDADHEESHVGPVPGAPQRDADQHTDDHGLDRDAGVGGQQEWVHRPGPCSVLGPVMVARRLRSRASALPSGATRRRARASLMARMVSASSKQSPHRERRRATFPGGVDVGLAVGAALQLTQGATTRGGSAPPWSHHVLLYRLGQERNRRSARSLPRDVTRYDRPSAGTAAARGRGGREPGAHGRADSGRRSRSCRLAPTTPVVLGWPRRPTRTDAPLRRSAAGTHARGGGVHRTERGRAGRRRGGAGPARGLAHRWWSSSVLPRSSAVASIRPPGSLVVPLVVATSDDRRVS